ncbi:DsbA family protein [Baekduia soli]|uniref:DsbA family protein n=1 Tax=Baekduia soli TaxID=496014 RepID=UPI001652881C|nr:thioredoxin domain-containing protein [Baekduia soli]
MSRPVAALAGLLGVATAVVVVAILVSSRQDDAHAPTVARSDVTAVFRGIPQSGITLGDPAARVVLVEVADPQCPYCREFHTTTLPAIVRRYVATGKIRMQMRLTGFLGHDSVRGARALEAAGLQDRMWEAAARFYAAQGQENTGYVTDAFLRRVLGGVRGLDAGRALADRADPRVEAELGAVHSLERRYAVDSTPTLLIGRDVADLRKVSEQTPSIEQIGATIDAELAKST